MIDPEDRKSYRYAQQGFAFSILIFIIAIGFNVYLYVKGGSWINLALCAVFMLMVCLVTGSWMAVHAMNRDDE